MMEEDAEQKIREASSMAEVMELFDRLLEALASTEQENTVPPAACDTIV